ncbi:MAG: DoxX family protein [Bacteroidales bacterium]|nr:DoxX family protein [Bacteroidales bacterium]MCK9498407.1 DoxX family protein [Bacteroidales bacterium]MDY0314401.1 DoxX family protein [Bacteroidales bacterium]NLB86278.1 DoxX family protein [Bacteroidales bacterium]
MLKYITKLLLGLIFISSAILKLYSIDDFEIYIFAINLFPLDFSILLARLIIGFELFLGILLCLNFYKFITNLTIIITSAFTVFLAIRVIAGDVENCQCFGSNIFLSPAQSIIKNAFLIAALVWVRNSNYFKLKYKKILSISLLVLSLVMINILSPPDFLYYNKFSKFTDIYNPEYFEEFKENSVLKQRETDKTLICFLSTKCSLCSLTAKKISALINNHNISKNNVLYVFIESDDILSFLAETKSNDINYIQLPVEDVLQIGNGGVPVVILYENKVVDSFVYRGIVEKKIVKFFKE